MTIDEAIKMYKKIANTDANCPRHCMRPCEECVQECKQVLEWLEDYKQIKMLIPIEQVLKAEYNKAIDECLRKLNFYKDEWDGIYHAIEEIEQLKAGVESGIDNQ